MLMKFIYWRKSFTVQMIIILLISNYKLNNYEIILKLILINDINNLNQLFESNSILTSFIRNWCSC